MSMISMSAGCAQFFSVPPDGDKPALSSRFKTRLTRRFPYASAAMGHLTTRFPG